MKFPYNITITHLSTTALCTTPFLMIACFTLGNSINGCSISTCHHTMSKFQCSNYPSPYFLTQKNASHSLRTSRPSVTISKYSIILTCPKYSRYPQFPHVPYIQHRNFHYISLVVHDWFISDYVGLRELTTSPAVILRVAKTPSPRPGESPTLQQRFILASLTTP